MFVNPLKASIFAHSYDELRQGDREIKKTTSVVFRVKPYKTAEYKTFF